MEEIKIVKYESPTLKEVRNTEMVEIDKVYVSEKEMTGYCTCPCRCY